MYNTEKTCYDGHVWRLHTTCKGEEKITEISFFNFTTHLKVSKRVGLIVNISTFSDICIVSALWVLYRINSHQVCF